MLQVFWKCRSRKLVNKRFWCANPDLIRSLHLTDEAWGSDAKCQRWGCLILRPDNFLPPDASRRSECLEVAKCHLSKVNCQLDPKNRICLGVVKPTLSFVFVALLPRMRGTPYLTLDLQPSSQLWFQSASYTYWEEGAGRRWSGTGASGWQVWICSVYLATCCWEKADAHERLWDRGILLEPALFLHLPVSQQPKRQKLSSSSQQWAFGWPAVAILCLRSIWWSGLLLI